MVTQANFDSIQPTLTNVGGASTEWISDLFIQAEASRARIDPFNVQGHLCRCLHRIERSVYHLTMLRFEP